MHTRTRQGGFTLIELMIVLVVLAILLTIAAPSFRDALERRRVIGASETIYSLVQLARSEAIKQSTQITVALQSPTESEPVFLKIVDNASLANSISTTDLTGLTVAVVTNDGNLQELKYTPRGVLHLPTVAGIRVSASDWRLEVRVNALGRTTICFPGDGRNPGSYPACT
ncbi:GspH/FimT family pseudopilin [Rhodocyclaceae bacterium SMB388]